jgi:uncharacterized membrane protein YedE/YeeE
VKEIIVSLVSGFTFAVGLAVSGMTQPTKVVGFLDFLGDWDPSLAFVMGGAIAVYLPLFRWVRNRERAFLGAKFLIPTRKDLSPRLIAGSALFGIGWGLAGFCPGPAIVAASSRMSMGLIFFVAMVTGMLLFRAFEFASQPAPAPVKSS